MRRLSILAVTVSMLAATALAPSCRTAAMRQLSGHSPADAVQARILASEQDTDGQELGEGADMGRRFGGAERIATPERAAEADMIRS